MKIFKRLAIFSFLALPWCSAFAQSNTSVDIQELRSSAGDHALKGEFEKALEEEQRALAMAEKRHGLTHPDLIPVILDLAAMEHTMGHYPKSEEEYRRALDISEKNLGANQLGKADCLESLAALLDDGGQSREAEELEKKALTIRAKSPMAFPYLQILLELGSTQWHLKKNIEAEKNLSECAEKILKALGPKSPLLAEALETLAEVQAANGHPEKAEAHLLESLANRKKNFMANDVEMVLSRMALGNFYLSQREGEKAKPYLAQALGVFRLYTNAGDAYPVLPFLQYAAALSHALGKTTEAKDFWLRALKVTSDVFGAGHPRCALCRAHLALDEKALGENDESQKNLQEALATLKTSLGEAHPLTKDVQKQLAGE